MSDEVKGKPMIMAVSAFLAVISIIEIVIGSIVFVFVLNVNIGAFWAGAWGLLTAISGFVASNRPTAMCFTVMASISVCVALTGMILDGIGAGFFTILTSCAQFVTPKVSGVGYNINYYGSLDQTDQSSALLCAYQDLLQGLTVSGSNCYCAYAGGCNGISNTYCTNLGYTALSLTATTSDSGYSCYYPFRLNYPSNWDCGDMMGSTNSYYVQMLSASTAMCALLVIASFILSIVGCMGVCGKA